MVPVVPAASCLKRDLSAEYESRGASQYDEVTLQQWKQHRDEAAEALKRKDWCLVIAALQQAILLRPDWASQKPGNVYGLLSVALQKSGDAAGAHQTVNEGLAQCISSFRHALETGQCDMGLAGDIQILAAKGRSLSSSPAFDTCRSLGVSTIDTHGEPLLLYRDFSEADQTLLSTAPEPLRLLFLDVDGVLNTTGSANSGELDPTLLTRLLEMIIATNAVVVLSTSWRNFPELRPLIISALPQGRVIGQTPAGYDNHVRPQEIWRFLQQAEVQAAFSSWVALDDMDLVAQARDLSKTDKGMAKFVHDLSRHFVKTDKTIGLDSVCASKALALLTAHQ
jgi:hypothetical protein